MADDAQRDAARARGARSRRGARRREEILRAAEAVLRAEGVSGFTVEAVAARLDVSKAAIYYYFPTGEAMVVARVVGWLEDEAACVIEAVEGAPDGLAALEAMLRARLARCLEDPQRFRLTYNATQLLGLRLDAPTLARIYSAAARCMSCIEARLRAAQDAGLIAPDVAPRRLANAAWMSAQGVLQLSLEVSALGGAMRFSPEALIDELCARMVDGVRTR